MHIRACRLAYNFIGVAKRGVVRLSAICELVSRLARAVSKFLAKKGLVAMCNLEITLFRRFDQEGAEEVNSNCLTRVMPYPYGF